MRVDNWMKQANKILMIDDQVIIDTSLYCITAFQIKYKFIVPLICQKQIVHIQ